MLAVLIEHTTMAGAHEELRFLEPPHRAAKMGAIDGEDLELFSL